MDSDQDQASSSDAPQTILLHVLSPSLEVPNRLSFPDVSVSMTIIQLKRKIQDAVASKPAPERQRLIYRGKALVRDDATLAEIFGPEIITNSGGLSLHLVLPPVSSTHLSANGLPPGRQPSIPRSSSVPPPNTYQGLPPLPQPRSATGQIQGQGTNPAMVGGLPPMVFPSNPHFPSGQLPQAMQELLNSQLAALGQQMAGQHGLGSQHPSNQGQFHAAAGGPPMLPSQFQQILAQQQQARASAGGAAVGSTSDGTAQGNPSEQQPQSNGPSMTNGAQTSANGAQSPANGAQMPANAPGQPNQAFAPNQAHWRMVINQTTTRFPTPGGFGQPNHNMHFQGTTHTNSMGMGHGNNLGHFQQMPDPSFGQQAPFTPTARNPFWTSNPLLVMHQRLSSLEMILDNGGVVSEEDVGQAGLQLTEMITQHPASFRAVATPMTFRLNSISARASLSRASARQQSGSTALPNGPTTTMTQSPTSPTIYLLSSPSGPQALLLSPSHMYTTPGITSSFANNNTLATGTFNGRAPDGNPADIFPEPGAALPFNQQMVPDQRQQDQGQGQVRDLLRILLPLGGNLWLLIRLLGVVYMFTGGWRRTIILGIGAVIAFIAQTGAFGPIQRALWEPIRRHMEGLLEVGGNVQAPVPTAGADGQPRPEQMADRLLRERQQGHGMLRRNFRRFERAVALFLASLVPGVGEQHIAARDAAEAARLAQEREREENARREEEQNRQDEEAAEQTAEEAASDSREQENGNRQQTLEQPLIEI